MSQVILCCDKYFSYPTYISSYITDQSKVLSLLTVIWLMISLQSEFPEITFCAPEGYKKIVLQKYGISSDDYKGGY